MALENRINLGQYDQFLNELEESLSPAQVMAETDAILNDLESDLENYQENLKNLSTEEKRALVLDTNETYKLNLLAEDENFQVRTLALCNPHISPGILYQMVDKHYDDNFILMVIANNPHTTGETLEKIFDRVGEHEAEIRAALLKHPNCPAAVKLKLKT